MISITVNLIPVICTIAGGVLIFMTVYLFYYMDRELELSMERIEALRIRERSQEEARRARLLSQKSMVKMENGYTKDYVLWYEYRFINPPNKLAPSITWEMYDYLSDGEKALLAPDVPEYAKVRPKNIKEVEKNEQ